MAGGILFPWWGKLRLNLSLLHWKHIVLTTVPPGKSILLLLFLNFLCFVFFVCLCVCVFALPCWFSISSLIKLWHYECCIKLQQGERELCIPHTILCHPTMSIPNTRPDYFFRAGGMLKEGSRENTEDWIIMMGLSTQVLLSSSPGLCRPICSYQLHLHHSSQVMRISLLEDRRNPAFTPALCLSARNWLPQGHLINNVWVWFWLS